MIYILLEIFLILITTIFFKKKIEQSIFLILTSFILFILISTLLPDKFNNDQFVFLDIINKGYELNLKVFFLGLFDPNLFYNSKVVIEFAQFSLGLANLYAIYLLYNYSGLHNLKMWSFLILCSGFTIHVFSFLREPFLYFFITIFVYFLFKNKVLLSLIFIALIALARVDALIYTLPFFIIILSFRNRFKHIYKIIVFTYLTVYWFSFYGPLSVYTEPYIRQFTLLSGLESNFSLIQNILNLITPSLSLVKILFQIQLIGILYFIFKFKNNINIYKASIYIFLFTMIILLSISNNYGFLLRITSGMALMFFLIQTNISNLNKLINET